VSTPATLDNNYYKLLPLNLGLHFSDDQLIRNATLLPFVDAFAANETLWKEKFVAAMIKMGNIDVLTGARGEIRLNCSAVNPSSSSSAGMIETIFPGAGGEVAAS
jgi:peroxidase